MKICPLMAPLTQVPPIPLYLCYLNMQTSILCVMECYYEMRHTLNYMSLKNMTSYYEMRLHER